MATTPSLAFSSITGLIWSISISIHLLLELDLNPKFRYTGRVMTANDYTGESIKVLEGLEPVRKRPAMYIGSTSIDGVYHCLAEIIDNSIDEALAGYASNIFIRLEENNYLTVIDDGRGIPVDEVKGYKKSGLEIVMTRLHAGGKFDGKTYKISGGLHGVGASVVNALSSHLLIEVARDGKIYQQEYSRGLPKTKLTVVEKSYFSDSFKTGTAITFLPDNVIFREGIELALKQVQKKVKERAYLINNVFFKIEDARVEATVGYSFDGGILSLIRDLSRNKSTDHPTISFIKKINPN